MIIKTFTADTVSAALKTVRAEMGGDAYVLKTRPTVADNGTSQVEITACLDRPTVADADNSLSARRSNDSYTVVSRVPSRLPELSETAPSDSATELSERIRRLEQKINTLPAPSGIHRASPTDSPFEKMRTLFRRADVDEAFISSLKTTEENHSTNSLQPDIKALLSAELELWVSEPLRFHPGDRVAFLGMPGTGKTSLLGRVAARLVATEHRKVRLVSLDDVKVGAVDEIQSYGDLLDTTAIVPPVTSALDVRDDEILLIDTPALVAGDRREQLKARLDEIKPTYLIAVFSALCRSCDQQKFADLLAALNPTHAAGTMFDLTSRWGTILTACRVTHTRLAFITDAPGGKGELLLPTAGILAERLLSLEDSDDQA